MADDLVEDPLKGDQPADGDIPLDADEGDIHIDLGDLDGIGHDDGDLGDDGQHDLDGDNGLDGNLDIELSLDGDITGGDGPAPDLPVEVHVNSDPYEQSKDQEFNEMTFDGDLDGVAHMDAPGGDGDLDDTTPCPHCGGDGCPECKGGHDGCDSCSRSGGSDGLDLGLDADPAAEVQDGLNPDDLHHGGPEDILIME